MTSENYKERKVTIQIDQYEYSLEGSFWKVPENTLFYLDNNILKLDYWEETPFEKILQKSCYDSFYKFAKSEGGVN